MPSDPQPPRKGAYRRKPSLAMALAKVAGANLVSPFSDKIADEWASKAMDDYAAQGGDPGAHATAFGLAGVGGALGGNAALSAIPAGNVAGMGRAARMGVRALEGAVVNAGAAGVGGAMENATPRETARRMLMNALAGGAMGGAMGLKAPRLPGPGSDGATGLRDGILASLDPKDRQYALTDPQFSRAFAPKVEGGAEKPMLNLKSRAGKLDLRPNRDVHPTETPEFKAWFGESKLKDEAGQPLLLWHGTRSREPFPAFDDSRIGSQTDEGWLGRGHYFVTDPKTAAHFSGTGAFPRLAHEIAVEDRAPWAEIGNGRGGVGGHLGSFFGSAKNPLVLRPDGWSWDKQKLVRDALDLPHAATPAEVTAAARARGHDAVVLDYSGAGWPHQEVALFDPTQIKSATGNSGAFDPTNPRITGAVDPRVMAATAGLGTAGALALRQMAAPRTNRTPAK